MPANPRHRLTHRLALQRQSHHDDDDDPILIEYTLENQGKFIHLITCCYPACWMSAHRKEEVWGHFRRSGQAQEAQDAQNELRL